MEAILKKYSDLKYKKFTSGLIPNAKNILGIRLPILRKLARGIEKEKRASFLRKKTDIFEEKMIQGMIIGLLDFEIEEILFEVEKFIPKIDNWAICDTFCAGLKCAKKNKDIVFEFIKKYREGCEFEKRFFLCMSLFHFVEEKYLKEIFEILNKMNFDEYYAQMGAAWLISVFYVKFPEETKKFLLKNNLDQKTHNRAIQKIIESRRVSGSDKKEIRKLKT